MMIGTYVLESADKLNENNKRISKRTNIDFNKVTHLAVITKIRMN